MKLFPSSAEEKLGFPVVRGRLDSAVLGPMGRERLDAMRPASTEDWLREELGRVSEMQEALRFDDPIPFGPMLDVRDELRRATPEDAFLAPEELVAIRNMARSGRLVSRYFGERKRDYPALHGVVASIQPVKELEEHVDRIIGDDGRVRDDASPELSRLRTTIVRKEAQLRETLERELRRAVGKGYATEGQPTIRNGRMVIPVRAEAKRKIDGFVQDTSASGQTAYIEPAACLDLNNEVRSLQAAERREVERILRVATSEVRHHRHALQEILRALAQLDLLQAKARLANDLDAVVPEISGDGIVDLRNARNPVLLLHLQRQQTRDEESPREVVPLTVTLGGDYRTLIITGPNAGGKTVAMKTVGLMALMLAYGLPIPVDDTSRVPLFEQICVDIGDEQSIEEDLSTFSSHISNLRHILSGAGERTLVLIDEAGTGTDPSEGGALAQAILERLTERGARTIATTHHGTLKVFAHETDGVENGSMEFDHDTLRPTYRFQPSIPGSSYAFEIAQRIGLSPDLIDRARTLVGEQKAALEDLITTMEARSQELADRLAEAEEAETRARQDRTEYEERLRKSEKEREEIRRQALEEAERIVQEANARVERTIREIKEAEAEREATRKAREKLERFKEDVREDYEQVLEEQETRETAQQDEEHAPAEMPDNGLEGPLQVGDRVRLDDGAMTGEVQEIEDDEVLITAGSLRMRVAPERLVRVGAASKEQRSSERRRPSVMNIPALKAQQRIDLRGYHVDEALPEVERFLDDALAAGLDRAEILHGKGTGALREAIHDYLHTHPAVASFQEAPLQQGGAGVTVVTMEK